MFCDRCGTKLAEGQRFCPSCGKPAGAVPLMPVQGRIAGHVRLLGILWLASAAVHLIPGFFLLTFFLAIPAWLLLPVIRKTLAPRA